MNTAAQLQNELDKCKSDYEYFTEKYCKTLRIPKNIVNQRYGKIKFWIQNHYKETREQH